MVYIVIVNYNAQRDLKECLVSLKKLRYPSYKVVVVDNGSHDGSSQMVKAEFPWVELIELKTNLGFAGGNNVGIEYALKNNADYILLLNNDTIVEPNFLNDLVKVASQEARIGLVAPKILFYPDSNLVWSAGGKVNLWLGQTKHLFGEEKEDKVPSYNYEADYLPFAAVLIKKEVFEKIGLLDPAYFLVFEDTDFCLRAKRAGFRLIVCPRSKIWHKASRSFKGTQSPLYLYYIVRNKGQFMKKNGAWYHWFIFPEAYLVFVLKKIIACWLKNNPQKILATKSIGQGFYDFLRGKEGRQ